MPEPLPVTRDDEIAAWNQLYARTDPELAHIEIVPPNLNDRYDQITLAGLRRALKNDRTRVIERAQETS